MKKHLLVVGKNRTGKTTKIDEFLSQYKEEEVCYARGIECFFDQFGFHFCTEDTKAISLDETSDMWDVIKLAYKANDPVIVNKKRSAEFTIQPIFAIELLSDMTTDEIIAHYREAWGYYLRKHKWIYSHYSGKPLVDLREVFTIVNFND